MRASWWRVALPLAAGLLTWARGMEPLAGQESVRLTAACGEGSATLLSRCAETVLAAQAAQGGLGLMASRGGEVTGAASTLGWRLKGSPRYAVSLQGALLRGRLPDLARPGSSDRRSGVPYTLASGHLVGAVGIFDGFSPAPTVGGLLSLDLVASLHLISAPETRGFTETTIGWGGGARLGILRESFTLPGVSLSAAHRWLGSNGLGSLTAGDSTQARFDLAVSSLRAVIGKDLGGVGVSGGFGWDRYAGDTTVRVEAPGADGVGGTGLPQESSASGTLSSDRLLYFLSGTLTYVILQASLELGWGQGFRTRLPPGVTVGFDPSSGAYFGSLAFRLTY